LISSFNIAIHVGIQYYYWKFFWVLINGHFQLRFPSWFKPTSIVTLHHW